MRSSLPRFLGSRATGVLVAAAAASWVAGASTDAHAQGTTFQSNTSSSSSSSSARSFRGSTGSRGSSGRGSGGSSASGSSRGGGTSATFTGRGSSSINLNAIAPGATLYRWYDKVGNIHYGTYEQAPKGAILAGAPGVDTRKQLIADFYGPAGPPKPQIHVVVQKEVSSRAAGAGASPPSSRKPAKAPSAGEPPASVEEAPVVPDVQDAPGAGEVP